MGTVKVAQAPALLHCGWVNQQQYVSLNCKLFVWVVVSLVE